MFAEQQVTITTGLVETLPLSLIVSTAPVFPPSPVKRKRREAALPHELEEQRAENLAERRERYVPQDYSMFYDRLKAEYKHPLLDEDKFSDRPVWTKDEVIDAVENKGWRLGEGRGGGITVWQPNGRMLYGSPPPMPLVGSVDPYADEVARVRQGLHNLNNQMDHDVQWIANLMAKVNKGDVSAMRLYAEIFIIPKPVKGPTLSAKTVNVSYSNQTEQRPIKDI